MSVDHDNREGGGQSGGIFEPLRMLLKSNPLAAGIIIAGMSACLAVVFVIRSGFSWESHVPPVAYLIVIGFALYVVASWLKDETINGIIRWVSLVLVGLWICTFVAHKVTAERYVALGCIVYLWRPCAPVADEIARTNVAQSPGSTTTQAVRQQPIPATPSPQSSPRTVTVQFAGYDRDTVRQAMLYLAAKGWRVAGAAQGGERTISAVGYREIRFRDESDRADAEKLASDLAQTGLAVANRAFKIERNPLARAATLEVWVSQ